MAEVKWIKLFIDMWNNRKIKQIETLPDGDTVLIIWLKLLTLAGNINDGGMVYFTKDIPFNEQMLANEFGRPLETVKMALNVFEKFGMVELFDDMIHVSNWEKYQNTEGMEKVREQTRKRVLKYREKKKNELINIGAKCAYCGEIASGVDHIIPLASGGTDNEENLVPCCLRCNRAKNDKPIVKFLNTHREFINVTSVLNEEKLAQFVAYDAYNDAFYDVTENVTLRNATERREKKEERRTEEKSIRRFTPPTLEEIHRYCWDKGLMVDEQTFFDYYNESGWVDSKGNKVKNWKQKLITWAKHDRGNAKPKFSAKEMEAEEQDIDELKKRLFGEEQEDGQ